MRGTSAVYYEGCVFRRGFVLDPIMLEMVAYALPEITFIAAGQSHHRQRMPLSRRAGLTTGAHNATQNYMNFNG